MHRIFIDGREGTTGLRIDERLRAHKDIEMLTLCEEDRKSLEKRREMLHAADIAFLCLPDSAAREAVQLAAGSSVRIIDASSAHRVDPAFLYGFPERDASVYTRLQNSDRVAVPGCHASGYIALAYPLVKACALSAAALLSCISITGYSGGGKSMISEYAYAGRADIYSAPRQYALSQAHKHIPEMQAFSGVDAAPVFMPVVSDFYAGMLVNIPLHISMLEKQLSPQDICEIYAAHYADRPMINVLPYMGENAFIAANGFSGRDSMEIMVAGNADRITLMARYDNLGKGASAAAIQCMNIMLGKHEADTLVL